MTNLKKDWRASKVLSISVPLLLAAVVAIGAQQAQPPVQPPIQPQSTPQPPAAQVPANPNDRQGAIVRNVNLVDVLFTVVTKHEKLVTDLNKEDFKVFDDGKEQEIISFSQPTELPVRMGVVLDTSNSIRSRLKFEQDAAIDFLYNTLRPHQDQAFLMSFDDGAQLIKGFTGDSGELRDTILKQRAGGGTALYDALYQASEQLLNKSPLPPGPNPDVRRVLVVISDGDDNSSNHSRGEAVEMAQRAGVIIYAISSSTEWVDTSEQKDPGKRINRKYSMGEGDHVLQQLAEETGGRAFFPYVIDDLGQSFLDISDELRHQYALEYSPAGLTPDGKYHTIRVQVNRKDVILRARKGYFYIPAPAPAAARP
jgi:Ca-activated chloride channel homolog